MTKLKLIFFLFFVCFQTVNAQNEYPVLTEIVTDKANLFSPSQITDLRQKLLAYEAKTTHQIVVLTITSLGANTIEDYAVKTFNLEGNKFGQAKEDNGILILISESDSKVRIEVGNGLEPIITDLFASRIIEKIFIPEFKKNNYFNGVNQGTSKIIELIDSPEHREEFSIIIKKEKDGLFFLLKVYGVLFLLTFLGAFTISGKFYKTYGLFKYYKDLVKGEETLLKLPIIFIINFFRNFYIFSFLLIFTLPVFVVFSLEKKLRTFDNFFIYLPDLLPKSSIYLAILLFIIIPLITALFTVYLKQYLPKLPRSKSFSSKSFSSSGVSSSSLNSGRSSFSSSKSSSSRSSFSGGGGRSSGGGASGGW